KAQAVGYERSDLYFYTTGELRVLLDSVFDQQAWHNPPQSDVRSQKSPAEGNNWLTTLADVSLAFKKLPREDRETILDFHDRGWTNKELADMHGVSEQVMSYRHNRALKRLQRLLGGPKPNPMKPNDGDPIWRGRRAISNRQA